MSCITWSQFCQPIVSFALKLQEETQEQLIEVVWAQVIPDHITFPGCTLRMIATFRQRCRTLVSTKERITRANGVEVPEHVMEAHHFVEPTLWCDLLEHAGTLIDGYLRSAEDALYMLNRTLRKVNGEKLRSSVKASSLAIGAKPWR